MSGASPSSSSKQVDLSKMTPSELIDVAKKQAQQIKEKNVKIQELQRLQQQPESEKVEQVSKVKDELLMKLFQISTLEENLAASKRTNDDLALQLKFSQEGRKKLDVECTQAQQEVKLLQQQITGLRREVSALEESRKALETRVLSSEAVWKNERLSLSQELSSSRLELSNLHRTLVETQNAKQRCEDELGELRRGAGGMAANVQIQKEANEEIIAGLRKACLEQSDTHTRQMDLLKLQYATDLEQAKGDMEGAQTGNMAALRDRATKLQDELEEKSVQIRMLHASSVQAESQMNAQLERLTLEQQNREARIVQLEGELHDALAKGHSADVELSNLRQLLASNQRAGEEAEKQQRLTVELDELKHRAGEREEILLQCRNENENLRSKAKDLESELSLTQTHHLCEADDLSLRVTSLEKEAQEARVQFQQKETRLQELLRASELQKNAAEAEAQHAKAKVLELEAGTERMRAAMEEFQRQISTATDQRRTLQHEVEDAQQLARVAQQEKETIVAEMHQYRSSIVQEVSELKAKVLTAQNDCEQIRMAAELEQRNLKMTHESSLKNAEHNLLKRESEVGQLREQTEVLQKEIVSLKTALTVSRDEARTAVLKEHKLVEELERRYKQLEEAAERQSREAQLTVARLTHDFETAKRDIEVQRKLMNSSDDAAVKVHFSGTPPNMEKSTSATVVCHNKVVGALCRSVLELEQPQGDAKGDDETFQGLQKKCGSYQETIQRLEAELVTQQSKLNDWKNKVRLVMDADKQKISELEAKLLHTQQQLMVAETSAAAAKGSAVAPPLPPSTREHKGGGGELKESEGKKEEVSPPLETVSPSTVSPTTPPPQQQMENPNGSRERIVLINVPSGAVDALYDRVAHVGTLVAQLTAVHEEGHHTLPQRNESASTAAATALLVGRLQRENHDLKQFKEFVMNRIEKANSVRQSKSGRASPQQAVATSPLT